MDSLKGKHHINRIFCSTRSDVCRVEELHDLKWDAPFDAEEAVDLSDGSFPLVTSRFPLGVRGWLFWGTHKTGQEWIYWLREPQVALLQEAIKENKIARDAAGME